MKRFIIFLLPVIILSACIKDRIPPTAGKVITSASDTLMYYWSFNGQDSSKRAPDFGINPGATFKYYCSYIDYTGGSTLNLWGTGADSGECLRVRNPSDSLIFVMPTTGFDSIVLQFAEEASSTTSGSTINDIYYTTDGVNYITTALSNNSYTIGTTFALYAFDFSTDPNVNDNPKFAVKIVFANNNTGTSGNDRFDNVSLQGVRK
jgi:hypothetical protein